LTLKVSSYAKINIGLRILGKRPDGYHEIETIFQQISLKDEIEITSLQDDIVLECTDQNCPRDYSNLAYKAARLLKDEIHKSVGCSIKLFKRIPIGAGLGGGSSNAATVLKALNELWDVHLPQDELVRIAEKIGSDVPFFIYGGTCIGQGRGEILTPIEPPGNIWGVLVCPPFGISSKWAYQSSNFSLTKMQKKGKFRSFGNIFPQLEVWKDVFTNDLEPVVFAKYPIIRSFVERFYELGAFFSQMSGSGSSSFGLFTEQEGAEQAYEALSGEFKKFLFHFCQT